MKHDRKSGRYERMYKQLEELLTRTTNPIARMATITAVLYHKMDYFFWCGFYCLVDGDLTVGPYQGPLACQVLKKDTGVCWAALHSKRTLIVPDVEKFPGHIACDSRSKSEIAVPFTDSTGNIWGVLDVDSTSLASFDDIDREWLERIVGLMKHKLI